MNETASLVDRADVASHLLTAMANAHRLAILSLVSEAEMSVGALAQRIGLSHSALSQHLTKLRALKLVSHRRDAQTIYYSCRSEKVHKILATLESLFGDAPAKPVAVRRER